MVELVYTRVSTDEQNTQRQTHLLAEAGLVPARGQPGRHPHRRRRPAAQPTRTTAPAADTSQPVRVEMPGKIARHLADHDGLGEAGREALRKGREVRRAQGYSLHVTAPPHVHHALLNAAGVLGTDGASPAERKAHRIYSERLNSSITAPTGADRPTPPSAGQPHPPEHQSRPTG
ncbi:hypothetical protein [Amycolatopsis viridis]|uniref:Resolvase/invertase-type recombinase catalytic domain-containing protein n=1 Tax=Amycolatopsis viridis TaxID=185678 RepID=A0ABX0SVI1_9PSEU|nr:hypothetical protein [Amycolatopsis viridis]NIH80409.1 hypothetical protein [Amycolatopsis viridis]